MVEIGNPHILAIPYPAQGHVIPLLELSKRLVNHGCKITFVNTEFNHRRIVNAFPKLGDEEEDAQIRLVSIPDGMGVGEDRNDIGKLTESICLVMPREFKRLIEKMNESDDAKITCVLTDMSMGWVLELAADLGIRRAAFWPAAALLWTLGSNVQKLLDEGVVDENGTPLTHQAIRLSSTTPAMNPKDFVWACIGDFSTQKILFDVMLRNNKAAEKVNWILCNSTYDLEPGALALAPKMLAIGPLLATDQLGSLAGHFWTEDANCIKWLDQQPSRSVIYVAFGSFTVFDQIQFQELALGLELSNRSFLWVVRPDITEDKDDAYPEGFQQRVADRGQIVGWAPQRAVLAHPSIACFLSHCGWNSTVEGVSNGVPLLCWPYFADQFLNESYVCDIWKVGLKFKRDENGIITREEIKNNVEILLGDRSFKTRAAELKEVVLKSVHQGGCSDRNFKSFIKWMKS